MHKKIIFDTNFLLTTAKFNIDIFSELKRICDFPYKLYILEKTIKELKGKKGAKLALDLIREKVKIIKTKKEEDVDTLLLNLKNFIIATQDKALKKKLKEKKRKIITIRQKKYLNLD